MRHFRPRLSTILYYSPCRLSPSFSRPAYRTVARLILPHPTSRRRITTTQRLADPIPSPPARQERFALPSSLAPAPQKSLREPLQAGASSILLILAAASAAIAVYATLQPTSPSSNIEPEDGGDMADLKTQAQPGRAGNLTPEQEEKLRELWAAILRVCGVADPDEPPSSSATAPVAADKSSSKEKGKKRRVTLFSRKGHKDKNGDWDSASTKSGMSSSLRDDDADDKYGQNKQFLETLANTSPEIIRATIWAMVKHDHPDALVLRFLRARKWDVEKALVMLISTMNWRANEMHVDDEIMKEGDAAMVELSKSRDPKEKQLGEDFMAQIRMGKSFLHGVDDQGRPICVVRVRLHHQGEQCEESLEKYIVYLIETARMVLRPPVDTATIMFDMTGFSMANMDYTPVKFMIKCFEANYPESLGSVLVHKAPWLFQGVWKLIRSWLDPVVASKVHFTNNLKDLGEFIAPSRVLKEFDGEEDWEYKYIEPLPNENEKMNDTATCDGLLAARKQLYDDYEQATIQWIKTPEDAAVKTQRDSIASKLRADYWVLDPHLRARSFYDRTGWIQGQKVEPYPTEKNAAVQVGASTNGDVATSTDDVD